MNPSRKNLSRRAFMVGGAGVAGISIGAAGFDAVSTAASAARAQPTGLIPATEELMTDHGLLKRILLIYREYIRRLDGDLDADPNGLFHCAQMVHDYVEGFHEGIEEGFIFPRLLRAGQLTDTVQTLLTQHDRGRKITIAVIQASTTMKMGMGPASPGFADHDARARLSATLSSFVRMYEPHEAREDTEVFPAFRRLVDDTDFTRISQQVNDIQHARYGDTPLAGMLGEITDIERELGIHELAQFTPSDR